MKTTYNDPQVKLNTNRRGKTDYDIVPDSAKLKKNARL